MRDWAVYGLKTQFYGKGLECVPGRIVRLICVILVTVLVLGAAAPGCVEAASARDIEQQIIRLYKQARTNSGRYSFDGYCAALVSWQLYLLGITDQVLTCNGNQEYDAYAGMSVSPGGYHVNAYPASRYTLEQCLNLITDNGQKDAYNILVGFQETPSSLGRRFGHALVVHAILDGMVYFVESYGVNLNGRHYPEGSPISCSIADFADYYGRTTISFDGVIHFTEQEYVDDCKAYPAFMTVVASNCVMRSMPCEPSVNPGSQIVRYVLDEEQLPVTGLFLNSQGEYWYRVGDDRGYIPANRARMLELRLDDLEYVQPVVPTVYRQGKGFSLKGQIDARFNSIYTLRAQVYDLPDQNQVLSASATVEGKSYDLSGSTVSRELAFRTLPEGHYRLDLTAVVCSYYLQDGRLQLAWGSGTVWSSEFQVVEQADDAALLVFDARGGSVPLNQMAVAPGQTMENLPLATLENHVFMGWYTSEGVRVDETTLVQEDMVLFARWIHERDLLAVWDVYGQCVFYYSDGVTTTGCIQVDDMLYYFSAIGTTDRDQLTWVAVAA